jgi:hypothetical protein
MVGHSWKSCLNRAADESAADGHATAQLRQAYYMRLQPARKRHMRVKRVEQLCTKTVLMYILHVVMSAEVECLDVLFVARFACLALLSLKRRHTVREPR